MVPKWKHLHDISHDDQILILMLIRTIDTIDVYQVSIFSLSKNVCARLLFLCMLTLRHDTHKTVIHRSAQFSSARTLQYVRWQCQLVFIRILPIIDCFYYSIVFRIGLAAEATAQLQLFTCSFTASMFGASRFYHQTRNRNRNPNRKKTNCTTILTTSKNLPFSNTPI